jgi:hypothetical protein
MASRDADNHARSVIVMAMMVSAVMVVWIGQEEGTADESRSKNGQDFFHWVPLSEMAKRKREGTTEWCLS